MADPQDEDGLMKLHVDRREWWLDELSDRIMSLLHLKGYYTTRKSACPPYLQTYPYYHWVRGKKRAGYYWQTDGENVELYGRGPSVRKSRPILRMGADR